MDNSLKVLSKFYTVMLGILLYIKLVNTLKHRPRPHYSVSIPQDQKKFSLNFSKARTQGIGLNLFICFPINFVVFLQSWYGDFIFDSTLIQGGNSKSFSKMFESIKILC